MMDFDLDIGHDLHLNQGDAPDTSYTAEMATSPGKGKSVGVGKKADQKNGGKFGKKDDAKLAKSKLNKGGKTQPPDNKAGGF